MDRRNLITSEFEKLNIDDRILLDNNNNDSGQFNFNLMNSKEDCCSKVDGKSPVSNNIKKHIVTPVHVVHLHSDENKMRIFMEKIQVYVQQREKIMKEIDKRGKTQKGLNKNKDFVQYTSLANEIKKLNKDKEKISSTILKKYSEYSNGDNLVLDLHGLMKNEVQIVLPQFFRRKLAQIGTKKKITCKVITGVGTTIVNKRTSVIRTEVDSFLLKKDLQ